MERIIINDKEKGESMDTYIFLTNEGYTYQPNSESIEPDCENSQLIGIAKGNTQEEAFNNLISERKYLREFNFDEIYCYKLAKDFEESKRYFYIKDK
jgi:hypothetical protein